MQRVTAIKVKRAIDIAASLGMAVVFAPVFVIVAALVWYNFGRPVIFKNPRIGQFGAIFNAYKFRSMRDLVGPDGKMLPDAMRMTRFSKWLRASSLDELPQLWNVLKGEMSLIGPRPIVTDYLPYVKGDELRRLDVPPGISGWAQVNGRNSIDWDARLEMDVWYVDHWSLALDLKILLMTLPVWLGGQGVNSPGMISSQRLDDVRRYQLDRPAAVRVIADESVSQDG